MQVFDKIDPLALERREFQLGILAISTIAIMATGLAAFMYQTVFSIPVPMGDPLTRRVFFAFCAMSILMIGYLLNRQFVIYRLRARLADDKSRLIKIRSQACADLLKTLPGLARFQDRLAMDFRRCANSKESLSVLLYLVTPNPKISDDNQLTDTYGDAAKALLLKMRKGDSLYLFESGTFAIVLPGFNASSANRLAERFSRSLEDASSSQSQFTFNSRVINYPEEFSSARDMEQAARYGQPVNLLALPLHEDDDFPVETTCET